MELLLQKTNVNIEFIKPNNMGINEYNYEWTRAFHTLFSEIVTELGEVCDSKNMLKNDCRIRLGIQMPVPW
jgi:hypothetical protein